jgi:hypothetical protein
MTFLTSFVQNAEDTLTAGEKVHAEDNWIIHHLLLTSQLQIKF